MNMFLKKRHVVQPDSSLVGWKKSKSLQSFAPNIDNTRRIVRVISKFNVNTRPHFKGLGKVKMVHVYLILLVKKFLGSAQHPCHQVGAIFFSAVKPWNYRFSCNWRRLWSEGACVLSSQSRRLPHAKCIFSQESAEIESLPKNLFSGACGLLSDNLSEEEGVLLKPQDWWHAFPSTIVQWKFIAVDNKSCRYTGTVILFLAMNLYTQVEFQVSTDDIIIDFSSP